MIVFAKKRLSICKQIEAPPVIVWDILTDTSLWSTWGPSILAVECSDRHIRQGSNGRIKTLLLFWLPFSILEFRQMDYWNWRVGPLTATGHRLVQTGDNSCNLCFEMSRWAAFYLPICWLALFKIAKIAALKSNPA